MRMIWLLTVAAGMVVANLYYSQPLVVNIAHSFALSPSQAGFLVSLTQLGYGFGFTAFMLYMLYFADGPHKTAHYAICTGFMALGMMVPGMLSGWLQEIIGYQHFFVWVMLATIPGFIVVAFIPLDARFGKKASA